jgi:hypothetical protein
MTRRTLLSFFWLLCGLGSAAAAESPTVPHVDDPANRVEAVKGWALATEARLAAFEKASGIRILVQFHAAQPAPGEDKNPGDYMRALATRLGVIRKGILAVSFAGDPDWRVWIGDELAPKFVGRPGSAKEFTESGAMHKAKEAFLAGAELLETKKSAGPGAPDPGAKLLTLQADALLDGLSTVFAP